MFVIYSLKNMILINQNLEAFLSIAESGSVTATSKKLNLTQSAITQRIKSVEATLKVTLFTRSKAGMKLTPEGVHLLQFCNSWREKEGQLLAKFSNTGKTEEVSINIVSPASLISGRLIDQCMDVYRSWPELNLSFFADSHLNRLEILKKGSADLAVLRTYEVTNQLDSKKIMPLEYVLVGPADWKKRSLVDVFQNERFLAYYVKDEVSLEYLKKYNLADFLKKPILYINDSQSILKMAEYGLGFGLISSELLNKREIDKSICILNEGKSLKINLALAWLRRDELPPYFKKLIASIH